MLEMRDVTVGYHDPILRSVSLTVDKGERLAVLGANGSGKSTLLRCACAQIDVQQGVLVLDGVPVVDRASRTGLRERVGYVGQDPDDQMVSSLVFDEVAFGPCNLGWKPERIREAVRRSLALCELTGFDDRDVSTLSGGQRQRVAIAGVLAMEPDYLLLDEPCAMLDALSRSSVTYALERAHEAGTAIVQVTHELEDVLAYDRLVVLGEGGLAWEGSPTEFVLDDAAVRKSGCLVSDWLKLARTLVKEGLLSEDADLTDPCSCAAQVFARGTAREIAELLPGEGLCPRGCRTPGQLVKEALMADEVAFSYGVRRGAEATVRNVNVKLESGRVVLMVGITGSGKSTVAKLLSGLLRPGRGEVTLAARPVEAGQVGYSFQSADDQLFADTVLADVAFGPKNVGLTADEAERRARRALRRVRMDPDLYGSRSPFALSGGQRRRVALAGVFALESPFVVLDEPTVGLDASGLADLERMVRELTAAGAGVLMVSHDLDRLLPLADDVVAMAEGEVLWSGSAEELSGQPDRLGGWGVAAFSRLREFQNELRRLRDLKKGSALDAR